MSPDYPEYQERVKLRVSWGYSGSFLAKDRIVFIKEVIPNYSDNLVTLEITATDASIVLNQNKNRKDFSGKSFEEIITEIVQEDNKLKLFYSSNPETGESYGFGTVYDSQKRTPSTVTTSFGNTIVTNAVDQPAIEILDMFKTNTVEAMIGGGRSDKAVIDEVLEEAPGGPYVMESRDDGVTIKKRNFGKNPFRSYHIRGENGTLLSFKPETKRAVSTGAAATKTIGGKWDVENKEYTEEEYTELTDGDTRIGEGIELESAEANTYPGFEEEEGKTGVGKLGEPEKYKVPIVVNTQTNPDKTVTTQFGNKIYLNPVENTGVIIKDTYLATRDEYIDYIETGNLPTSNEKAKNSRAKAAIERSPANATIIGDTEIQSGQIITILGVANKFAGNYYIEEAEHIVDTQYIVNLTLRRNGLGIPDANDPTTRSTKDFGIEENTSLGPDSGVNADVTLPETNAEDFKTTID